MLCNRRAAFHPVAAIDVADAVDFGDDGVVDMAADDAIGVVAACLLDDDLLELADEIDGRLHLLLRPGREGPVRQAEPAADGGEDHVDRDRRVIGPVAEIGDDTRMTHDHVELVSVQHQIAPAVSAFVDHALCHLDTAEMRAREIAQELVVIAGDVNDACTLARLAQDLLRDIVEGLRPVPVALEPPAVDDIADEHDGLGLVMPQEVEQEIGLGGLRSQMHIRDEERAEVADIRVGRGHGHAFVSGGRPPRSSS